MPSFLLVGISDDSLTTVSTLTVSTGQTSHAVEIAATRSMVISRVMYQNILLHNSHYFYYVTTLSWRFLPPRHPRTHIKKKRSHNPTVSRKLGRCKDAAYQYQSDLNTFEAKSSLQIETPAGCYLGQPNGCKGVGPATSFFYIWNR